MVIKAESPISIETAERKYGIQATHGLMLNGEKRFRLSKIAEGSGYIRTEASESGGWQNAHYHEQVLETYVVQTGWIVACELRNSEYSYMQYNEGEVFTTSPNVVHNIYMPANAVLHTVKHGQMPPGKSIDRIEKAAEPEQMTKANKALSETELLAIIRGQQAHRPSSKPSPSSISDLQSNSASPSGAAVLYNDVYRHFDNLIWKTPAWSVAVITIAFIGAANMKQDGAIAEFLKLHDKSYWPYLPSSIFLCMGLFLVLLSYILYRFRWHQAGALPQKPKSRFFKSQALLQLFISLEALALLALSLWGFGMPVHWLLSGLIVLLLSLHYAIETSVYMRGSEDRHTYTPS